MRHPVIVLVLLILHIGIMPQAEAQAKEGKKKRIAIFQFDDKTDNGSSWWGQRKIGEGMSDMITTELVKTEQFIVIERSAINALMKEQDFGASGAVTPETAAKIGQILGVEIALFGAVTEFGYNKGKTGVNLGGTRVGLGKQSAVVGLDLRLVNTSTAEIVDAENIRRQKSAPSINISTSGISFENENEFNQSIVGKATREAVDDVISRIAKNAESIPWSAKVISEVATKSQEVIINSGKNHGVENGEVLIVYHKGKELIDPDTGLSLGTNDTPTGKIKVVDNMKGGQGKAASCVVLEMGSGGFKRGDIVREH